MLSLLASSLIYGIPVSVFHTVVSGGGFGGAGGLCCPLRAHAHRIVDVEKN